MTDLRERLQASIGSAYSLGRELGGGGMSRVFVATDERLHREVVIKVLAPELAAGISAERFEREIRMAAALQHPNIVPVLAAGDVDGLPYYTMPLVDGASLRERIADVTRQGLGERVEILRDVARALAYAHKHGIVHRDIKPENILLTDGAAAVTDFGIAKALVASRGNTNQSTTNPSAGTLTAFGTSLGTPAYMAPEQAAGDAVDPAADVYSWGIIAWELLAGRHPFAARAGAQQLIMAQLSETPARLDTIVPAVSPALAALVARCVDKDRSHRPASGAELLAELEAARTGPTAASRRPRSRSPLVIAVALIVVALAGGAWAMRAMRHSLADAQVIAVTPFRVAGADPSLHYLREGMLDLIAAKLGGGTGARAVDSRTLLAAWKRAGGDERTDLDEAKAVQMAAGIGAGDLLTGDVVGNNAHITLNGRIVSTADGKVRALGSVEGPADSLTVLVDRLCAKLLSLRAGMSERSLAQLTSTSLPALRFYLEGHRLYRQGLLKAAAVQYTAALAVDSTFAQPAIDLAAIGQWGGFFQYFQPGAKAVARLRSTMGPMDRVRADAIVGEEYPREATLAYRLTAAQKWATLEPENVEAVANNADVILHFGRVVGMADADERARDGFLRALTLDSTYTTYVTHMPILFAEMGDTAALRRLVGVAEADSSHATLGVVVRVLLANARNDTVTRGKLLAAAEEWPGASVSAMAHSTFIALCPACADSIIAQADRKRSALTPAQQRTLANFQATTAFLRGQPVSGAAFRRRGTASLGAREVAIHVLADGDSALAETAVDSIQQRLAGPVDDARLRQRISDLFAVGLHAGNRRDTAGARRAIRALDSMPTPIDSVTVMMDRRRAALILETQVATMEHRADLPRVAAQLDSAQQYAPAGGTRLAPYAALILSRAYEQLGDNRKALAAVFSAPEQWGGAEDIHVAQMRQAGRLAAALGERRKALEYFRWYLAYRSNPEPSLRKEADEIRKMVAQLEARSR